MLRQLMGWLGKAREDVWAEPRLKAWAAEQGWDVRSVNPGHALLLDGLAGSPRVRLEWGVPQRFYIGGQELRLRADMASSWAAQLVIMNRSLRRQLEREVFEEFVEEVQTRVDTSTPPEMRLLVMLPKVAGASSDDTRVLSVLATEPERADQALNGPLGQVLGEWAALDEALGPLPQTEPAGTEEQDRPFVVLLSGRKLTWRTRLDQPSLARLSLVQAYFERLRHALSH